MPYYLSRQPESTHRVVRSAFESFVGSLSLSDAYANFILSRKAAQCSPATLEFYKYTEGKFVSWLGEQEVNSPKDVASRHVRKFSHFKMHKSDRSIKIDFTIFPSNPYASPLRDLDQRSPDSPTKSDNAVRFAAWVCIQCSH